MCRLQRTHYGNLTKRGDVQQAYLEHWLATAGETGTGRPVDAIIAPVAPFTAVPHGKYTYTGYIVAWNVLDFPALLVPVSGVDPKLDFADVCTFFLCADEPETFKNVPVGIQVVGRTQEDEAVTAIGEVVDSALEALRNSG
ncbi:hypothetical protein E4T56_gene3505 [Termitomyces sp. T112]|nr:hypothetical protein E4T56_gene3505 [Termitomyces sp. T112]